MNTAGMIVIGFFSLIGLISFVLSIAHSRGADEEAALILLRLTADTAEFRVRRAVRMCERIRCDRLICRCRDQETENICEVMQRDYGIIEIERE